MVVHPADVQDRDGASSVLECLRHRFSRLRLIVADSIYNGGIAEWVRGLRARGQPRLELVHKRPDAEGFEVLTFRWRVERTFAWLGHWRRLSKDYEERTSSSEALIKLAMIHLMVHRLVRKLQVRWLSQQPVSPESRVLAPPPGGDTSCAFRTSRRHISSKLP